MKFLKEQTKTQTKPQLHYKTKMLIIEAKARGLYQWADNLVRFFQDLLESFHLSELLEILYEY